MSNLLQCSICRTVTPRTSGICTACAQQLEPGEMIIEESSSQYREGFLSALDLVLKECRRQFAHTNHGKWYVREMDKLIEGLK